jgi:TetR/AcrR family transcriptional regulator, copper-responsive repressor
LVPIVVGSKNVETFLKNGPLNKEEHQGCFSVNSMREFAILPDEAYGVVTENRALVERLLAMNIEAEKTKMAPSAIAEIVRSFFSGLCIERNLKSGKASSARKIENFMIALRSTNRAFLYPGLRPERMNISRLAIHAVPNGERAVEALVI